MQVGYAPTLCRVWFNCKPKEVDREIIHFFFLGGGGGGGFASLRYDMSLGEAKLKCNQHSTYQSADH